MDIDEKPSLKGYLHNIKASFRPMMQEDLKIATFINFHYFTSATFSIFLLFKKFFRKIQVLIYSMTVLSFYILGEALSVTTRN